MMSSCLTVKIKNVLLTDFRGYLNRGGRDVFLFYEQFDDNLSLLNMVFLSVKDFL